VDSAGVFVQPKILTKILTKIVAISAPLIFANIGIRAMYKPRQDMAIGKRIKTAYIAVAVFR